MAFLRKAEAEIRQELLDMAWQHDFSSARMNEILAHAPDLVNAVDHHGKRCSSAPWPAATSSWRGR
ncbi:hypothetical protein ACKZDW_14540 [Ralstonia syzygii subsp. celebesensis]